MFSQEYIASLYDDSYEQILHLSRRDAFYRTETARLLDYDETNCEGQIIRHEVYSLSAALYEIQSLTVTNSLRRQAGYSDNDSGDQQ